MPAWLEWFAAIAEVTAESVKDRWMERIERGANRECVMAEPQAKGREVATRPPDAPQSCRPDTEVA